MLTLILSMGISLPTKSPKLEKTVKSPCKKSQNIIFLTSSDGVLVTIDGNTGDILGSSSDFIVKATGIVAFHLLAKYQSKQRFMNCLPGHHFIYVQHISTGMPVFLLNYSDRKIYGVFEAVSNGALNINPHGWTHGSSEKTSYPAQVQVCIRQECEPLSENDFKGAIYQNYYHKGHFWFELDQIQTDALISLLLARPLKRENVATLSSSIKAKGFSLPHTEQEVAVSRFDGSYISRGRQPGKVNSQQYNGDTSVRMCNDEEWPPLSSEAKEANFNGHFHSGICQNGQELPFDLRETTYIKTSSQSLLPMSEAADVSFLQGTIEKLKDEMAFQNDTVFQLRSRNEYLEQTQVCMEAELITLREQVKDFTYRSQNHGLANANNRLWPMPQICLLGGYDDSKWLNTLDAYFPDRDLITPVAEMPTARAFAAATVLDKTIYVFGGGIKEECFETVDRYDLNTGEWKACSSMKRQRGCLSGVTCDNKIFALGGGCGEERYSDVEMYDPMLGNWLMHSSMIHKRFALAASAMGGAIYAFGGYDGSQYLRSVERFDPRQGFWSLLQPMTAARASLATVVQNDKIYAIGGYNGSTYLSSVEVFDPRAALWFEVEPLSGPRGYGTAAILGNNIYVIGGHGSEDTAGFVDRYTEGIGWRAYPSAIGKRLLLTSVVVENQSG